MQSPSLQEPQFREESASLGLRVARVVGTSLLGGVFATVVGLLGHQVATGEHWEVDEVSVAGNLRSSEAAIRHLADVPRGQHLLLVDLREIATRIEAHPWVRHVEVRRVLPSTIEVLVEEYEPAMLVTLDRLWLIDDAGRAFKQAHGEDLDLPILTGLDQELADQYPKLSSAVVQGALRILRDADGHPWVGPATISEVRFNARLGYTVVTRNGSELIVGFGSPADALSRLDRLLAAGLDLKKPQRVDLDAGSVAIATPLPDLRSLTTRP